MRDIERRLTTLERRCFAKLSDETVMAMISDEDLDWLLSRPANAAGTHFDFSLWTASDLERAEAIGDAARLKARAA